MSIELNNITYKETEWKNGETSLNATRLNKIENGLSRMCDAINANNSKIALRLNKVDLNNTYVEGEVTYTGKTWTDGTNTYPIYRKVLTGDTTANGNHLILIENEGTIFPNFAFFVNYYGFAYKKNSDGSIAQGQDQYPFPYLVNGQYSGLSNIAEDKVIVSTSSSWQGVYGYKLVIEYAANLNQE